MQAEPNHGQPDVDDQPSLEPTRAVPLRCFLLVACVGVRVLADTGVDGTRCAGKLFTRGGELPSVGVHVNVHHRVRMKVHRS